jgi:hypothetical protein
VDPEFGTGGFIGARAVLAQGPYWRKGRSIMLGSAKIDFLTLTPE